MKPTDLRSYRETALKTSTRWHREALPPSHCHLTACPRAPLALMLADTVTSHSLWLLSFCTTRGCCRYFELEC